ncbi:hypothetical protein Pmani_025913 [Petrolisthes manimaculis]|uniref:Uncharacterized protein n=1 Tax=Petrolisthes manimaculis TaxID=1843537 RepID=A0AAE1P6A8_9EUCA|nr:hypothetical protein Pmani_025913 [Petrolisthes manimaculis]
MWFLEGRIAVHDKANNIPLLDGVNLDDLWIVLKVESVVGVEEEEDEGTTHIQPLQLYAALNVGREGWCVLTRDLHTFTHVLLHHNMSTEYLPLSECNTNLCTYERRRRPCCCRCRCRCCVDVYLVPRVNTRNNYNPYFTFIHCNRDLDENWNFCARVHKRGQPLFATCFTSEHSEVVMEDDERTFLSAIRSFMRHILRINKS